MTRRNRRKATLIGALTTLLLITGAVYAAGPWTEAHAKTWQIGFAPLDAPLTLAERDYYELQDDQTGLRITAIQFRFAQGCDELEPTGLTQIHVYIRDRAWPHLPISDKALPDMSTCSRIYTPLGLHGRDTGGMNVLITAHVRIRDWPDKDPVFDHDVCRDNGC